MKVAWVCYYPASLIPDRPMLRNDLLFHPVPWISMQAPLVAGTPGIELHIVTVGRAYLADDHFEHDGIHFHFLRLPRLPRSLAWYQIDRIRIHQCLRDIEPDLVHGFGTESSYGYAAVTSGYPTLLRIQGIQAEIFRALGVVKLLRNPWLLVPLLIEYYTIRRCKSFVTPTHFAADFVRRINPSATVHMLKTPVRPEYFKVKRKLPPFQAPVLLFVGSVIPAKGIEVLLRAFAEVLRDFPSASLHVIGYCDPVYMTVVQSMMAGLGIEDRVVLHGYCEAADLVQYFAEVTLLVLPTLMDTAPNVIAEAQVAGVPVVATAVGGIPEMIESDVTGVLVQSHSVESLTAGILRVLNDPALAKAVAVTAQERAQGVYAPHTQVAKLVEVYRTIRA